MPAVVPPAAVMSTMRPMRPAGGVRIGMTQGVDVMVEERIPVGVTQGIPVMVEERIPVGVAQGVERMVVTKGIEMQGIARHERPVMMAAAIRHGCFIGSQGGQRGGVFLAGIHECQHKQCREQQKFFHQKTVFVWTCKAKLPCCQTSRVFFRQGCVALVKEFERCAHIARIGNLAAQSNLYWMPPLSMTASKRESSAPELLE